MADKFEITTVIRPKDDEGSGDYQHDCVELVANERDLTLRYCEGTEEKNPDGKFVIRRKSFSFDLSYAEFDLMVAAVARSREVARIAKNDPNAKILPNRPYIAGSGGGEDYFDQKGSA